MATYIALLRGINVGGNKMMSMADVREKLTAAGYEDVRTLLQSGNVIFKSRRPPKLDGMFDADVILRTAEEWDAIVDRNPFRKEAKSDPGYLVMMALKDEAKNVDALRAAIVGRERLEADGKQLYIVYPDGQGRSKLTNAVIEKKLGTRGSARNWNTVLKIQALLGITMNDER